MFTKKKNLLQNKFASLIKLLHNDFEFQLSKMFQTFDIKLLDTTNLIQLKPLLICPVNVAFYFQTNPFECIECTV